MEDRTRTQRAALEVARKVRVIGAATPANAASENVRLVARFERGDADFPRWEYTRPEDGGVGEALHEIGARCATWDEPARSLYSTRIAELRLEAAMAACAGTPAFADLARERFLESAKDRRAANALAEKWAALRRDDGGVEAYGSLEARVKELLGEHRAAFDVRVVEGLGALAATGERTVYVAGRAVSDRVARRVALHEVFGHVLPRVRAAHATSAIYALGTARGTDDQEGLALVYEERAGFLDANRRAELGRRHLAVAAMREGADFVDVVRLLVSRGSNARDAVLGASRVFRGSDGRFAGLGRESVYITSFRRVRATLRKMPSAERILASGQIAVSALAQLAGRHASPDPPPISATV